VIVDALEVLISALVFCVTVALITGAAYLFCLAVWYAGRAYFGAERHP